MEHIRTNAGLEAKTIFAALQRTHPDRFSDCQLRTLQRRIKRWRASEGPAQEVYFVQEHRAGELCESDFTHMTKLGITIGKTHMLQAVSQELVRQCRRMPFTTCGMLVQDLLNSKRDLELSRPIERYSRYKGMVIDDLGYIRQTREGIKVVFTLLAERYERGSVLLTSNLPFSNGKASSRTP